MACLTLGLPHPSIPGIFLPSGTFIIQIPIGSVGITCCHFTIPGPRIPIPIPPIVPPAALIAAITAINVAIAAGLAVLDQVQVPDCPIE